MEPEFKPGDRIRVNMDGGNNSSAPEYNGRGVYKGDTVYTIKRVETEGVYKGKGFGYYTLILTNGYPLWACHCELIKEEIINCYEIY